MKYKEVKNYIGGKFVQSDNKRLDVFSPLNGKIISTVPLSGYNDLDKAVKAAQEAFPKWAGLTSKKVQNNLKK
ncbi:MAG: aldehyde dehydrogenase family protein [Bacteroidales bacterium]|nr:aldehyde dehydrogenase family protein [Bacteroidales bacterium]